MLKAFEMQENAEVGMKKELRSFIMNLFDIFIHTNGAYASMHPRHQTP
jgi:hypothetical protein